MMFFGSRGNAPRNSRRKPSRRQQKCRQRLGYRLRLEPLEERALLSVSPTEFPVLAAAITGAADLNQYTPAQLAQVQQWVVGYSAGQSPADLAAEAGATFVVETGLIDNSAIFRFPANVTALAASSALQGLPGHVFHYPLVPLELARLATPDDAYFPEQWHLQNTGQVLNNKQALGSPRSDANVAAAWDTATGKGVVIGIVDDAFETRHPDLSPGFRADLSFDFVDTDPDPNPVLVDDNHGTAVGGVAGARGFNGIGATGAAPEAELAGLRFLGGFQFDFDVASAVSFKPQEIDIYNNSWGPAPGRLSFNAPLTLAALLDGTTNGRGVSEVQEFSISGSPTGGTFTLSFRGQTTIPIAYNAQAADIDAALEALFSVGAGNVRVTGGPVHRLPVSVEFTGTLTNTDVAQITANGSRLTGGSSPAASVRTMTNGGGFNEVQQLSVSGGPTGGTFTLTFAGQTTSPIPYNANTTTVDTALEALSRVGAGNVTVTGGPLPGTAMNVVFTGALAQTNVAQLSANNSGLRGGSSPAVNVRTTTVGRGPLGSIYVFAAGNGQASQGNVNYNSFANSRHVIAVGAINNNGIQTSYSEPGSPMLVAAPSGEGAVNILTTDRMGVNGYNQSLTVGADGDDFLDLDYTSTFNGTSSSAPLVSGIIALMLEANPNLTWRDVQQILVETSRKTDPNDLAWSNNGATLFNGGAGFHINYKYGFGAIDADAAVKAAQSWTPLVPQTSVTSGVVNVLQIIPDDRIPAVPVESTVTIVDDIQVERVEVVFSATHARRGDLRVELISPSGTRSELADDRTSDDNPDYNGWVFSSVRHWGESARGDWILSVMDRRPGAEGIFDSWQLNLYGVTNYGPRLTNDQVATFKDRAVTINVLGNDVELDGTFNLGTLEIVTPPAGGQVSVDPLTGEVTYTPNTGFVGTDTFTYFILDDEGADSNIAAVTVTVANFNAPVANNETAIVRPGTSVPIDVLANDLAPDGILVPSSVTIVTPPAFGAVSVNSANGRITYSPGANFTTSDSFRYTVEDNRGIVSNVATVSIVRANEGPTAADDATITNRNATVVFDVLGNDSDSDGVLDRSTVRIVSPPTKGSLTIHPTTGVATYTPKTNFFGTDRFTYTVNDNQGATSNVATVDITVQNVGAPIALNDQFVLVPGFQLLRGISVLNNPTGSGTLTAKLVATTSLGVLSLASDGSFTYAQGPNFRGLDQFVYQVNDGTADSNPATIRLVSLDFNFVRKLYRDVLSRGASDGEILGWVGALSAGLSRDGIIRAFLNSAEYQATRIGDIYQRLLGRSVDAFGLVHWLGQLQAGLSIDGLTAAIASSAEYAIRNASTDSGYIAALYRDVLGRGASAGDVSFWVGVLAQGTSRFDVAMLFLTSAEHRTRLIREWYLDYLKHDAEQGGINHWLKVFGIRNHRPDVQAGILVSQEYFTIL